MSENAHFAYLFVIDSTTMTMRNAIDNVLDDMPDVVNWQIVLPDAVVLVSQLDVHLLNIKLKEKLPGQKYLITLLERGNKQGWLAKSSWTFINDPQPVDA